VTFLLRFKIYHYEGPRKPGGTEITWDTSAAGLNLLEDNTGIIKAIRETQTDASKYMSMLLSRHQNAGQNHNIKTVNRPFKKCDAVQIFGNDSNKSKFDSGKHSEEIRVMFATI
jgi:hypothetical protein